MASPDIEKYAQKMEEFIQTFSKGIQAIHPFDMKEMDITLPQFMVLKFLTQNDNCKMSELSEAMKVTMGNMTGLVDRLVREGYVGRAADREDRRIVRVKLAKKGKDAVAKMIEHRTRGIKHMFSKLSESEIETFLRIMGKIAGQPDK